MKPKTSLRGFLAIAGNSLLAMSSANATTYTWTQATTGSQDWTVGANWSGTNIFASSSANELAFSFTGVAGNATTVTNVPATLSMNVLTLGGAGANSLGFSSITIGTSASTWTIGDGTTSTVNLTSTGGGGNADREIRYDVAANLTLNQATTTFTGGGTALSGYKFSGNITGAAGFGITKSGISTLVFSGNNSYSGTTLVSGGILRLNSANALSGGIGATGGTSALTINGGVVELGAGNFQRNLGTGSDQFRLIGTTSGFSAIGGPRVITVNNDASQELVWGSTDFNPTNLVLNATTANNTLELTNRIDLGGSARTFQVNANKALLSGVIRNGNLAKTGVGTLVLTGSNTYGGNNTLTGGTLSISAANNVGTVGDIRFNGGNLQIRGPTLTSFASIGSHDVQFLAANAGIDIQDAANTFTADEGINIGNKAFTKLGAGTLVLNFDSTHGGGAAATTTLTGGGTLVLDYTTNTGSKISDLGVMNLNGNNLVLKGGTGLTEIVLSTGLGINSGNAISRFTGVTGTTKIALGTLTVNTHAFLTIADDTLATTSASTTITNGILTQIGRVTVGSNFATRDVSNNVVAYAGYADFTAGAGGGSTGVVNRLTGGGTMSGDLTSYALKIANSGANDVLNMNSGVDLRVNNTSTILYDAGASNNTYTINGDGYLGSDSGNQAFNVNVFQGTLTVNAKLTSGGSSSFAKGGAGTLVAGGTNTYTGATFVTQGVLRVANDAGLGDVAGGTTVQAGAALELSSGITVGEETLALNGAGISGAGALRNHSGSNIYDGLITIGVSGARINSNVSTSLELTGGIATTLVQDVTFGGAGDITVSTAAITGSGGLIKDGVGTTTLSATNDYTGGTTVSGGTLTLNKQTGSLSAVSALTFGGAGTLKMDNVGAGGTLSQTLGALTFRAGQGTVQTTRTADFDQAITFASLAARTAGASGNFVNTGTNSATNGFKFTSAPTAGTLIDRGLFYNGSSYATYDAGGFVRGFTAGDTDYLTAPAGVTIGASTSSSNVDLTTGAITAQTAASANTINLRANNLTISSGILQVNGILSSGATDAQITGGTLQQTASTAGLDTVVRVNGSSDKLTIGSTITDNTNAQGLTKSGAGTLVLTDTNSYTGATTISAGTFALSGNGRLADTGWVSLSTNTSVFSIAGINAPDKIAYLVGVSGAKVQLGAQTLQLGDGTGEFLGDIEGGGGSLTKSGTGVQTLSGNNTYSGSTNIAAGTLLLGSPTALPDSAGLTLSGGILKTGAFTETTGVLTVGTGTNVIDFTGTASILNFANSAGATWGGVLKIWYWNGAPGVSGGTEMLNFPSNTSLTGGPGGQLEAVQFYSDNGLTPIGTGATFLGATGELVPVPEPSALSAFGALLGFIGFRNRRAAAQQRKLARAGGE